MSQFFVRFLKVLTGIVWVFLLVLFSFVEIVLVVKALTGGYFHRDIDVQLRSVDQLPSFTKESGVVRIKEIMGADAKVKLDIQVTGWTVPATIIGFTLVALTTLTVVYQFRKILFSISRRESFDRQNIRRLRLISFALVGVAVFDLLGSFFNRYLLNKYASDAAAYYIGKIEFGFTPILIAMVVFILSEIFRQGYALKTENESFV